VAKNRRVYCTYPNRGAPRQLPQIADLNVIHLDKGYIDNKNHPLSTIIENKQGKPIAPSVFVYTDRDIAWYFDSQGGGGFEIKAGGRVNMVGIPMTMPGIRTSVATSVKLIFSVYPEPIAITEIDAYSQRVTIAANTGAAAVDALNLAGLPPIHAFTFAVSQDTYWDIDRVADATSPILRAGATVSVPMRVNTRISVLQVLLAGTVDGIAVR